MKYEWIKKYFSEILDYYSFVTLFIKFILCYYIIIQIKECFKQKKCKDRNAKFLRIRSVVYLLFHSKKSNL